MAAAAETIQITENTNVLGYIDADRVSKLQFVRSHYTNEALDILEQNRELLRQGDFDVVPIPVDALGTAHRVLAAGQQFGENGVEQQELHAGLTLDCKRLLGEAYRKNTWEYFPKVLQPRDPLSGEYYAHGQPINQILIGGLSPVAEPEEQDRRVNEFVEEKTYQAIGKMCLGQELSVQTISECPDWAIEAYERDPKAGHGGYAPGIRKLMIRNVSFVASGDRYEEQVALSGIFIDHDVITEALEEAGGLATGVVISKTELHGRQFIDTQNQDVIGFVELLDEKASLASGHNIFMGEIVEADFDKNYELVRQQAEQRQQNIAEQAAELRDLVLDLARNKTDRWLAGGIVENFVQDKLKEAARQNPEQAAIIFDQQTAEGYEEVVYLKAVGRVEEAEARLLEVEAQAPAPSYCGAGSCGLEAVTNAQEIQKAKELGLDTSKKLLRHKDGKCKNCGTKGVVYDLTSKRTCLECHKTGEYKK